MMRAPVHIVKPWGYRVHAHPSRPSIVAPSKGILARLSSTSSLITHVETGHIEVKDNEGLIFVNNIFPSRLQWLLQGPLSGSRSYEEVLKRINRPHLAASDPLHIIRRVFPQELDIDIWEIVPRFREGGAFVKYNRKDGLRDLDIVTAIQSHLKDHPIRPWFNPFQEVNVAHVHGRPWIEDLYRIPTPRLRVEFLPASADGAAGEPTTEALYSVFRRYGKLRDIERQPSDSKVTPRYAFIVFSRASNAVMAKNCVHGFTIPEQEGGGKSGTRVKIKYEANIKLSMIKDWLLNHPRIVIPVIAALIAAITVTVFDPIRTFFIEMKIKATLQKEENSILRWIRNQVNKANIIYFGRRESDPRRLTAIWEDRQGDIAQLQSWLMENAETFIVIHGPRGTGKRELVLDRALENYRYKVVIDCKQIQDAKGDSAKISRAASQVGYRPIFSWMNSMSSFMDLAAQGMIGTKAGFSETLDAQLSKIWQNTATALKKVALENKRNDDKESHLSDEEYLEAHPEQRPVVVIDNFLHNFSEDSVVYEKLTEWAAGLTTGNIAHVIFLTTDVSFSKPLSKALPNSVFRTISLGDCSPEVGRKFVLSHLEYESKSGTKQKADPGSLSDLDSCIEVLGGRVTDLEFMARRIEAGETPLAAVTRIIEQSASEILKMFILGNDAASKPWTQEQAWHLIKALANAKDAALPYNQILLSDLFKDSGEASLRALEQAELISISSVNGCPDVVKPGKPVYRAVFKRLTENKTLSSRLDLDVIKQLISVENKSISKYEEELQLLGTLPKQPWELASRIKWLLDKIYNSQNKVSKYERESAILQKILRRLLQLARDAFNSVGWATWVALLVSICVATRLVSGLQSRLGSGTEAGLTRSVRMVPYWLPWIGHGLSFARDHVKLIRDARESMHEPVFGIYMGGTKHTTIVAPSLVKSVFTARCISSAELINYALRTVFGDRGALRSLSPADHHALSHSVPNLLMREPFLTEGTQTATRLIERQTPNLVTNCRSIVDQMQWERGSQALVVGQDDILVCEVNFFALIRHFVGHITTAIFTGESILEANPTLLPDIFTLDNHFLAVSTGLPRLLHPGVSAAHASRDRLLEVLTEFQKAFLAWDDGLDPGADFRDLDDISEPLKERIRKCKSLGLSARSSAPAHLSLFWAMNSNSPNVVFWHLLRIYADSALLDEIRQEIAPFIKINRPSREETGLPFNEPPRMSIDTEGLINSCLLLKASFYETLRLDSASLSFRNVTSDFTVTESEEDAALDGLSQPRSYKFEKGDAIIIPHAVIHHDPRYFSNPSQFDPLRFVSTDPETGEKKATMDIIKPFGGGVSGCKGRAFAERKLLAFSAAIIALWDVEPAEGQAFVIPQHRPSAAAFLPKTDIRVRMRQRI
ncbi:putative RNA12 protein [Aspergillus homomorphus CBS 101889]|uniref:Mitochondrial escape protein 2 n=1 Tax=Aspergillus homomorphus (strain CBS 101889) TaxID=1450537 RepID=A0A395HT67_ASPHC|nr:cytochrome P450 [Aspergillus homomorphus CBS 101889]RAL10746.1 cytochrome P450 [Aspergillus homomorphus CBS 101889]